jgi:excisionase family DNA binding protein
VNKHEAATYLEMSVRTLQRLTAAGEIQAGEIKGKTGMVTDYHQDELDRYKRVQAAEKEAAPRVMRPHVAPDTPDTPDTASPSQALERRADRQSIEAFVSMIADALQANVAQRNDHVRPLSPADLAHKLTLSITEAAALSGLSANHLREACVAGKLKAKIVGRGWKIRPEDLRAYVSKVMKANGRPKSGY